MKKILILSIEDDVSTTNVIRWITHIDNTIDVVRMHPSDFLEDDINMKGIISPIYVKMKQATVSTENISVVWMRKWAPIKFIDNNDDEFILNNLSRISSNLQEEYTAFFDFFIYKIEQNEKTFWLNKPCFCSPNKLKQLFIAEQLGLKTPYSILSTTIKKDYLEQNIITKPISDCISLFNGKEAYCNYTSRVTKVGLDKDFFVSYFQEEIKKEMELRIFFIDNQCYTVAILSQNNLQTEVDYRNYDYINPNREEYYQLPEYISRQVSTFMNKMNLQTGSLDFILDANGNYVFLEVNPCGQYDIFNLCNVYPDKLIAEYLIKKHYEY
jgi:ATP-GRASP peptide maturase of grasp-with-spasm system